MSAAHTELTPDEIVTAAMIEGTDPSADLAAWEQRELAALTPDAHPAERHAVTRAADMARAKYRSHTERTRRKSQWHEQRALERAERSAAKREVLQDPDATPTDVLITMARIGKASARVSACQQLLKQQTTSTDTSTLAIFCRGFAVSPDAPYADLEEARAHLANAQSTGTDAPRSAANKDVRSIALACLREVIVECEADTDTVRAAAALLTETLDTSANTRTRPIWIVRGRAPGMPELPIMRVRSIEGMPAPVLPALVSAPQL